MVTRELRYLLSMASKYYPEMRMCQIITNAAKHAGWTNDDVFYCPDETLIKGLKIMCHIEE